jgi:hypothetical protein
VAEALYRRGVALYESGDYAHAVELLSEALERKPDGRHAGEARELLRKAREKIPSVNAPSDDGPLDPYAGKPAEDHPVDPYGQSKQPPSDDGLAAAELADARRQLLFWGGVLGLNAGLAIIGPEDNRGLVGPGAIIAGLVGAGVGIGLGYAGERFLSLRPGQIGAVTSGGFWSTYTLALFGDVVTGSSTHANDLFRYGAAGAAVGTGAGLFYALKAEPSRDEIAIVNSMGFYATTLGFLLGVAMNPARTEAYSLNAAVGAVAGVTVGVLVAPRIELPRRRSLMIDLGAVAGGALPWILLYPFIADSGDGAAQITGALSMVTLAAGAVSAFFLTRGESDGVAEGSQQKMSAYGFVPALLQRSADGGWSVSAPVPRPLWSLQAEQPGSSGVVLDIAAGRF